MESRAGANVQQNGDRNMEKLMDEYLKAHGLQRKKIAKDGSCLFRAVAEQVLHCQGLHARVRAECVKYLRQNRDQYESFIEGDFEEYLHVLQDPQSWVGQVEISALAVLYKHDFIIYRQPGEPPVNITEHGYPKKVLLCFLNGNHYDSVYPISFIQNAAMCQSILYELLYERVCGVDRGALTPSLRASKAKNESVDMEERESSGDSDLDDGGDFWSSEATGRTAGVNNRTAYKGRGRGQARGGGRGCLLPKVQECLNPTVYRNMEYKMWLRLNRVQQRRDFCIAAGMHYKAGDKCQVRLNNTDRFYSAYIQDVSPGDGPVTVFIDELRETYSVPLWNLRTFSEDSWSTVTEKSKRQTASSTNGPTVERGGKSFTTPMRSVSHASTASPGSAPSNHTQQQQNSAGAEPQSLGKNDSSGRSGQGAGRLCSSAEEVDDNALLEILNKDEENFPTLEASAQAASVEGSRRAERKGSRKKAVADTKEPPPNPVPKAERGKPAKKSSVDQDQRIAPPAKEHPNPTPSTSSSAPSASKSTKAAASPTTAPTRVPYKAITSFACISNFNSQLSVPASSTRPSDSFQPATLKSGTAPLPNTSTKFPIAPASPARPQNQSQAVPAPASRSVVEPQAARDPVSPQTTHFQPQNLSVPSPVSSWCTPTNSLTAPKPISLTTNSSKAIQSQATDSTTPVPLDSRPEDMATSIPSQTSPMPLSTDKPASNLVSTPIHSPSSSPAPTHAISQTTSTSLQGLVPVLYQTTTAAEVPGLKDPPAASLTSPAQTGSEQPDSAGVTTPVHVPQSVAPPAQPGQSYPVEFGTRLPYPPYPPYPAPLPSLSPNVSAPTTGLQLPSSAPTPPFSHAAESYLYEPAVSTVSGAGGALVTDPLTQLCQDMLYPGFPQNDKNEQAQLPPFSRDSTGKDLPNDTSVLRFFFNLGLKAFLYQMFPPVSYLGPLVQAYRHMQLVPPSPVSWQPDNHSRPVITSSSPSPAGSTPVSHFELRGMVHTPHMEIRGFSHTSLPMQMPFPVASHPTVYAGMCPMPSFGPPLQYPAPPPCVGLHHLTISPPPPYAMEIPMPTVAPIMEEAQEVQRSLTPQVDKPFWAGQHQQPSEGGDIKSGAVPVTMGMQHSSGAQVVISGGGPGVGPEQTMLTNGNRQTRAGGFSGSSLEDWETEKAEFGAADSKTGQSYHGQSYKSGSRHGQDDRGGYRGRGSRGKREYTWGRQDGQLPYHRGRGKGRGYSNPRGSGYANRQFTRAPES